MEAWREELYHSSGPWKKHKYIKKENGKYIYPQNKFVGRKKKIVEGGTGAHIREEWMDMSQINDEWMDKYADSDWANEYIQDKLNTANELKKERDRKMKLASSDYEYGVATANYNSPNASTELEHLRMGVGQKLKEIADTFDKKIIDTVVTPRMNYMINKYINSERAKEYYEKKFYEAEKNGGKTKVKIRTDSVRARDQRSRAKIQRQNERQRQAEEYKNRKSGTRHQTKKSWVKGQLKKDNKKNYQRVGYKYSVK